ncbi:hypothetical protein FQN60_006429 [Etheostoma spectabile]|uniref:Uncharacterized protein n=1 Tax=Etheostoma spectabile TaxID=54343 RepID=A0A5J5CLD7_9PERO|nr:hypothetical protein FQN60_006429 [Etheostoma spectabile]
MFHLMRSRGPRVQDEQFAGEFQWDKDVLREGRTSRQNVSWTLGPRTTSSEKDDSDFMCPDSGLKTRECTSVNSSQIMGGALVDVGSMSLVR